MSNWKKQHCGNCEFHMNKGKSSGYYDCRYNPPQALAMTLYKTSPSEYPRIGCGESACSKFKVVSNE